MGRTSKYFKSAIFRDVMARSLVKFSAFRKNVLVPYSGLKSRPSVLIEAVRSIETSVSLGRGHTKKTGNRNFRELLSVRVEHMLLNGAAQIEETVT
jgi:hypothetical protein